MGIRHWSIARKVWALALYSWFAATAGAAWLAYRADRVQADAAPFQTYLLWQGLIYGTWAPAALLVWCILGRYRPNHRAFIALAIAGLFIVPVQAFISAALDIAFVGGGDVSFLAEQAINRLPVCLLLWTAIAIVGVAFTQYSRARQARAQAVMMAQALSQASHALQTSPAHRLLVSIGQRKVPVLSGDVEWFGSAGNYVVVHWQNREGLLRTPLKMLESELDPVVFARTHRSTLINLAMVRDTQPLSDGSWKLTMQSGTELVLSRTYRDNVLERLDTRESAPSP